MASAHGDGNFLSGAAAVSGSSEREIVLASASNPSALPNISERIQKMIQSRDEFASELEFEIEASKVHWSQVVETDTEDMEPRSRWGCLVSKLSILWGGNKGRRRTKETNQESFERLRKHRKWGGFFTRGQSLGGGFELGEKIGEGGQADIFIAKPHASDEIWKLVEGSYNVGMMLKVMKPGYSLQTLQSQWPRGMLKWHSKGWDDDVVSRCCLVNGGTLLEDGRFAFVTSRCWGDLRKLIDLRMQERNGQGPPFKASVVNGIMREIALGILELHNQGIVHRDLKASNVLITWVATGYKMNPHNPDNFRLHVADFECSVGVVGTGFWRAPEVLRALQTGNRKPKISKKADVYSFAMTCYEILTGKIPFEEERASNYDVVLSGKRPQLPVYLYPWHVDLLNRCWHPDPSARPSFKVIFNDLIACAVVETKLRYPDRDPWERVLRRGKEVYFTTLEGLE